MKSWLNNAKCDINHRASLNRGIMQPSPTLFILIGCTWWHSNLLINLSQFLVLSGNTDMLHEIKMFSCQIDGIKEKVKICVDLFLHFWQTRVVASSSWKVNNTHTFLLGACLEEGRLVNYFRSRRRIRDCGCIFYE